MTDLKISQLTSGNPAQSGDIIPVIRAGANFSLTASSLGGALDLSSPPPIGSTTPNTGGFTTLVANSASINAFSAGANGITNPAFNVDSSTASSVTGINIKSAAAGGGITVTAISSAINEGITIGSKGTGVLTLQTPGLGTVSFNINGLQSAYVDNNGFEGAIGQSVATSGTFTTLTANTNVVFNKTVTPTGTTGAQTINKTAGTVNFAAASTSLVVTNSLVTPNSIIICTVGTNDSTMKTVSAVAAAGSFTLFANAAATAETRVNFLVTN